MRDSETMYSCLSYQGILFDFDGVLSQSMEDNLNVWQAATTEYGIKIIEEDYFPLEGMLAKKGLLQLIYILSNIAIKRIL